MAKEVNELMKVWVIDDKWTRDDAQKIMPDDTEFVVSNVNDDPKIISGNSEKAWDLILVDQNFQKDPELLSVFDGSGFVAQLHAVARKKNLKLPPIVIITQEPDLFANEVPAVGPNRPLNGGFIGREPQLAPVLDVEWLLAKPEADRDQEEVTKGQVYDLISSFKAASGIVGDNGISFNETIEFLRLPSGEQWNERAISDVRRALPPISHNPDRPDNPNRGPVSLIRWLLHSALPYPGLFVSDFYVSARLGIDRESLDKIVSNPQTEWARQLAQAAYSGPGQKLFSRRWWTAGLDLAALTVFELDRRDIQKSLSDLAGCTVSLIEVADPVVVWNEQLVESEIVEASAAVPVTPPGWPAECIKPWMLISEVKKHPWLGLMVDQADAAELGIQL
ncbi:hypothetical protein [Microvirga sp. CF3016]|uniref:hypothetical protein n=1 Tax=Microvirga sp. CF3016 TaxID=3110181 RepID=UPI002E7775C5|nr:hypothetical protein [Microvirga sp. CF3016]MEE1611869.1 hypothetical protein [Microvirga sp. CF3016]